MAVPNPTDGPFPWVLFHRKDLLDAGWGSACPKTIDELYELGKEVTDPNKGVWAFDDIFAMVQMYFKAPGHQGRLAAEGRRQARSSSTRRPSSRQAAEFMAKLYKDGLVHPDVVASKGADAKQLFAERQDPVHAGRHGRVAADAGRAAEGHAGLRTCSRCRSSRPPAATRWSGATTSRSPTRSSRRAWARTACEETAAGDQLVLRAVRHQGVRSCASTASRASTTPGPPTAAGQDRPRLQGDPEPVLLHQRPQPGGAADAADPELRARTCSAYSNDDGEVPGEGPVGRAQAGDAGRVQGRSGAHRGQDHRRRARPAPAVRPRRHRQGVAAPTAATRRATCSPRRCPTPGR